MKFQTIHPNVRVINSTFFFLVRPYCHVVCVQFCTEDFAVVNVRIKKEAKCTLSGCTDHAEPKHCQCVSYAILHRYWWAPMNDVPFLTRMRSGVFIYQNDVLQRSIILWPWPLSSWSQTQHKLSEWAVMLHQFSAALAFYTIPQNLKKNCPVSALLYKPWCGVNAVERSLYVHRS